MGGGHACPHDTVIRRLEQVGGGGEQGVFPCHGNPLGRPTVAISDDRGLVDGCDQTSPKIRTRRRLLPIIK